jgi:hypothetical protein
MGDIRQNADGYDIKVEAVSPDVMHRTGSSERVLRLDGRQDIGGLVHRGRVCLHDEDGSVIELWDPESTDVEKVYRVKVSATLSKKMKERYPEPFPEEATTLTWQGDFVDAGSELYGMQGFEIHGWCRPVSWLVFRCIESIRLIVPE